MNYCREAPSVYPAYRGPGHLWNELAAEIAIQTVRKDKDDTGMIFNVFKDVDYKIYRALLERADYFG